MIIRNINSKEKHKAFNVYGKELSLTNSERTILQLFDRFGKEKTLYHNGVECYFDFKCIYCRNKQYQWMINASGLSRDDFINSFYHLLINGVIEKEFWKKDDNDSACFRTPIKDTKSYSKKYRYSFR